MGKLILLVDDDQDFLEQNRGLLEARGYRVACFSDPGQALASLRRERPDLVVTDLMMKNLDSGFSLARAIKSEASLSAIPVILVTAVASQRGFDFNPRTREELAAMNADAYFDKPVAPEALIAKVEELLV
jgi:CheY-like chemotaxis protein